MATTNISYPSQGVAILVTSADALANGGWCSSALVDNQTNKYIDAGVNGSLQSGTVPAGGGTIDFYVAISWDGVLFTSGADAGDAAITWGTTGNTHIGGEFDLKFLDSITVNEADDDTDIQFTLPPVSTVTNGIMPAEWCIVIENNTGAALHATGTNNHLEYTGVEFTSA